MCALLVGSFDNVPCTLTTAQMTALRAGGLYFNVHTTQHGGGTTEPRVPTVPCEAMLTQATLHE